MGSRLRRALLALLIASSLIAVEPVGFAATTKATAKPTAKATAKPTVKTTATSKATAKATAKATTKAKKRKRRKPKPKISVTPSPTPKWPPAAFHKDGEVYAKVPTSAELVSIISASKTLATQIAQCQKYLCGAIQVASETTCLWWEVKSDVVAADKKKLGSLVTAHAGTKAQSIATYIAISPESAANGGKVTITSVVCHHEDKPADFPAVNYLLAPGTQS
jgi:hypothetical protein